MTAPGGEGPMVNAAAQRDIQMTEELRSQLTLYSELPVLLHSSLGATVSLKDPSYHWMANLSRFANNYDLPEADQLTFQSLDERTGILRLKYLEARDAPQRDSASKLVEYVHYLKHSVREILGARRAGHTSPSVILDSATVAYVANMRYQYASPASTLKAYEGVLESTPERYRFVAAKSNGVVVLKYGNRRVGTGFLVKRNTVVTARHVVRNRRIEDLSVLFDYEEDIDGTLAPGTSCQIISKTESDEVELDVAAVRIQCPDLPVSPLQDDRVLNLATSRGLSVDAGLYVIGHPAGRHQLISDQAFLRFPYWVDEAAYAILRENIVQHSQTDSYEEEKFLESYQKEQDGYIYRSLSTDWGIPGRKHRIPTLGFEANATPGSSGSPVFSNLNNDVVGMLFAGTRDYHRTGKVSWMRHEAAIPSEEIIAWLQRAELF